ncbi:MAG: DUF2497 domain-containing protein [Rhizobiaceae bacterium]|nr:DUF2497 domain-containing protein [Rhizobiaceae bacterium]
MAQASSVPAREPSMEEILASIRRIIEDSDNAHSPASAGANTNEAIPAEQAPAEDFGSGEVEAFRSELSAMDQETEPAEAQAEVEAYAAPESAPEFQEPATPEPEQAPLASEPPAPEEPATAQPAVAYEPPASRDAHHTQRDEPASARTSIISETAGRQVAAAFEELSDAFASSQQRSFDDIAEELMRPMLQEWLDNNLPVLVERLVREEIERVARGGSR